MSRGVQPNLESVEDVDPSNDCLLGSESSDSGSDFTATESDVEEDENFDDFVDGEVQDDVSWLVLGNEDIDLVEDTEKSDKSYAILGFCSN